MLKQPSSGDSEGRALLFHCPAGPGGPTGHHHDPTSQLQDFQQSCENRVSPKCPLKQWFHILSILIYPYVQLSSLVCCNCSSCLLNKSLHQTIKSTVIVQRQKLMLQFSWSQCELDKSKFLLCAFTDSFCAWSRQRDTNQFGNAAVKRL